MSHILQEPQNSIGATMTMDGTTGMAGEGQRLETGMLFSFYVLFTILLSIWV
jgi:hypothetical protein